MDSLKGRCLTGLSAAGIQPYMFASNKLKENAGASEIVHQALSYWDTNSERHGAQRIYVGGGNALLAFQSREKAVDAVGIWSEFWLRKTPGLHLVAAHEIVEGTFEEAYRLVIRGIAAESDRPRFGSEPGAQAVVRACGSTGLAACEEDHGDRLSAEAAAKRTFDGNARGRLISDFGGLLQGKLEFPVDFADLGREITHIAVVHIDGDGIGARFHEKAASGCQALEDFSTRLKQISKDSLRKTIEDLLQALPLNGVALKPSDGALHYIPIRPLVHGGDDLTFVCHGKLGLALTQRYLDHFQALSRESNEEMTACGGIAIVPLKFPFARAYQLAEDLSRSAKRARRDARSEAGRKHGWLDFQIVMEGVPGSLEALRKRYRNVDGLPLLRRPLCLAPGTDETDPRYWRGFHNIWDQFTCAEWPRSRAKRLLDAIERGAQAVEETETAFRAAGISLPAVAADCWDALEMLDFHVALAQGRNTDAAVAN